MKHFHQMLHGPALCFYTATIIRIINYKICFFSTQTCLYPQLIEIYGTNLKFTFLITTITLTSYHILGYGISLKFWKWIVGNVFPIMCHIYINPYPNYKWWKVYNFDEIIFIVPMYFFHFSNYIDWKWKNFYP